MQDRNLWILTGLLALCWLMPAVALAQVTADDFMPVVQGGPSEVKEPAKVEIKKDVVTAPTMQDGINAAVKESKKELKEDVKVEPGKAPEHSEKKDQANDKIEIGAKIIKTPSGIGFVATGIGSYRSMENPIATRISKRKAYVIAFTDAKKRLAEMLGGLSSEGKEEIRQSLVNINLPKDEMTNISTQTEESLKQAVDMMLRGFVIYEVKDAQEEKSVYVSIVTTPKSRGQLAHPAPNAIQVDKLRDGIAQVLAEVRAGLVPPVGGRIITVRSTGETAFVGFGSAVVRTSKSPAAQAQLNVAAQKIADARAKDALCGLIRGDKIMWEGGVTDSTKEASQDFESATEGDPLASKDPAAAKKLDEARDSFVSRLEKPDVYQSVRNGIIPPGVMGKTWFDEDHAWAYGMAVYVPSATNAAASTAREMHEGEIVQPIDDGSKKSSNPTNAEKPSSGHTDDKDVKVQRPGKTVKPGPSGKIDPE